MDYIKKITEKAKEYINSKGKKKIIENSVIVIIIGIILLIAGDTFWGGGKKSESGIDNVKDKSAKEVIKNTSNDDEKNEIEKNIEKILSQIIGAGKVDVMITYVCGSEVVPAFEVKKSENNTDEKDNGGGTRAVRQDSYENKVVYEDQTSGQQKPMILKELNPEARGVVVVADGAANVAVRESIIKAVEALTDVPIHKIQVFERNNEK